VTTSTIDVTGAGKIYDLNVELDITHTYDGQLTATLYAPDGTPVELFSNVGGSGDNFTATGFDEQATTSITAGSAPFTGTFQPTGSLAVFNDLDAAGTWTLEIVDNAKGDSGSLNSWSIEITTYEPEPNTPPDAVDDTATTDEDTAVIISVLANDSDGDGDPIDISSVADPANGAAVDNGDGTITYTPDQDFNGIDTFTYTIDDGKGGTDTATVTVTVASVPDAPVAVNDTANTEEDTAVEVMVLNNDYDGDNDTLTVDSVTQPTNGSVANNGTSVTYTPNAGFTGTDTFDYIVSDGNGGTDTGTVEVTVSPVSSDTPLYVYDIRFVQHDRKADWWQAVFEIRADSDGDGKPDNDAGVAGVAITVNFAGQTFTGTTDANGVFTTSWVRKLSSGTDYYANAVDLVLANYVWNHLMDQEDDTDLDGNPDDLLSF
jgi:subtilisin-like proprotein convertase family protein